MSPTGPNGGESNENWPALLDSFARSVKISACLHRDASTRPSLRRARNYRAGEIASGKLIYVDFGQSR